MYKVRRRSFYLSFVMIVATSISLLWVISESKKGIKAPNSNQGTLSSNESNKGNISEGTEEEKINSTCNRFISALGNEDSKALKSIISPSGLIVIRNLTSSSGTRGRNYRSLFNYDEIPASGEFTLDEYSQVSARSIFRSLIDIEASNMAHYKVKGVSFNFRNSDKKSETLPSTDVVWDKCTSIRSVGNRKIEPQIYNLNDSEFILTVSEYELGVGAWAVFEKNNDKYFLRAIMDFGDESF